MPFLASKSSAYCCGGLSCEERLERVGGMPPLVAGQSGAYGAQGLDARGEQHGLAHRDDLGLVALLVALLPEVGPVRRVHQSGEDLRSRLLEFPYHGREVFRPVLEGSAVDEGIALGLTRVLKNRPNSCCS